MQWGGGPAEDGESERRARQIAEVEARTWEERFRGRVGDKEEEGSGNDQEEEGEEVLLSWRERETHAVGEEEEVSLAFEVPR